MFDRITRHAPPASSKKIHRTNDPDEQQAWASLRDGEPEHAMAHYHSKGRLFLRDTRDQAAEAAVQTLGRAHRATPRHRASSRSSPTPQTTSSTASTPAPNTSAPHAANSAPASSRPRTGTTALREGDRVVFIAQHHPRGATPRRERQPRRITAISERSVTVALDGTGRTVRIAAEDLESLRLAYAQHIYRQQGATVERAIVLTGGWQTSRETTYVEASRARHGTDWFIARDELGDEGQDAGRITRLAQRMSQSRAHTPSVAHRVAMRDLAPDWVPSRDPLRLSRFVGIDRLAHRQRERCTPEREVGPSR